MTRSNELGAELLFKLVGGLIIYITFTFLIDVFLSWLACMACNADFHTHYGTWSLFWIIIVANIWLSINVAGSVRSVIKKSS
jgi:hypothetical protein